MGECGGHYVVQSVESICEKGLKLRCDVQNRSGAAYFMGQNWFLGGHISMTDPYK